MLSNLFHFFKMGESPPPLQFLIAPNLRSKPLNRAFGRCRTNRGKKIEVET